MEGEFAEGPSLAMILGIVVAVGSVIVGLWHWYQRTEDREEYEQTHPNH